MIDILIVKKKGTSGKTNGKVMILKSLKLISCDKYASFGLGALNKRSILALIILLFGLISIDTLAQGTRQKIWLPLSVEKDLGRQFSVSLTQKFKFDNYVSDYESYYSKLGVSYEVNSIIEASFSYKFVNKNVLRSSNKYWHDYYLDLYVKKKVHFIDAYFRTRIQSKNKGVIRHMINRGSDIHNRNKVKVEYLSQGIFSPYVALEYYYDIRNTKFDKFRNGLGVECEVYPNSSIDLLYYFGREINVTNPGKDRILQIGYEFDF